MTEGRASSGEVGVGFSDAILLTVSIVGFCMLAVTIYSIIVVRIKTKEEIEKEELAEGDHYDELLAKADVSTLTRAQRRARARAIMKQQRRVAPAPAPPAGREGEDAAAQQEDRHRDAEEHPERHMSRKERQQAAKAAELQERRLGEERRRQQQKEAQELAQREKKERELLRAKQAEEEKQQKLERQKARYEEWLTFLSPSSTASRDSSLSVEKWIEELKETRTMEIEKVAISFGLSSNEVTDRIRQLIREGRVAGVIDETAGRFIYLTDEELRVIASTVKERGSVTLSEVAEICNTVLDES
jgi:hypothetical protein